MIIKTITMGQGHRIINDKGSVTFVLLTLSDRTDQSVEFVEFVDILFDMVSSISIILCQG